MASVGIVQRLWRNALLDDQHGGPNSRIYHGEIFAANVGTTRVVVDRPYRSDEGRRPGRTTADAEKVAKLEGENKELRRANDILKAASVFFATELDGPPSR